MCTINWPGVHAFQTEVLNYAPNCCCRKEKSVWSKDGAPLQLAFLSIHDSSFMLPSGRTSFMSEQNMSLVFCLLFGMDSLTYKSATLVSR